MIEEIDKLISRLGCEARIKLTDEPVPGPWSKWISEPVPGYIETFSSGPWPSRDVHWIDINPIATIQSGRLVKDKQIDYEAQIIGHLSDAIIPFTLIDHIIRVFLKIKSQA